MLDLLFNLGRSLALLHHGFTLLAQTGTSTETSTGFIKGIQHALALMLGSGNLHNWVAAYLPVFQGFGFLVLVTTLTKRFTKVQTQNLGEMVTIFFALLITLVLIAMPGNVFAWTNSFSRTLMPAQFVTTWNQDGTFTPPKIADDVAGDLKKQIVPPVGTQASANTDGGKTAWNLWGLTQKMTAGMQYLNPDFFVAAAASWLVQLAADLALFVLSIMYLVMALVLEINLLVFPLMIALWHTELFGPQSRSFIRHTIAVFFWPLGWGIGLLSAEAVMGGMTANEGTIAGAIALVVSLILVCAWLIFGAIAGPVMIHKLITNGASIGQGLAIGGLTTGVAATGATAAIGVGTAGFLTTALAGGMAGMSKGLLTMGKGLAAGVGKAGGGAAGAAGGGAGGGGGVGGGGGGGTGGLLGSSSSSSSPGALSRAMGGSSGGGGKGKDGFLSRALNGLRGGTEGSETDKGGGATSSGTGDKNSGGLAGSRSSGGGGGGGDAGGADSEGSNGEPSTPSSGGGNRGGGKKKKSRSGISASAFVQNLISRGVQAVNQVGHSYMESGDAHHGNQAFPRAFFTPPQRGGSANRNDNDDDGDGGGGNGGSQRKGNRRGESQGAAPRSAPRNRANNGGGGGRFGAGGGGPRTARSTRVNTSSPAKPAPSSTRESDAIDGEWELVDDDRRPPRG